MAKYLLQEMIFDSELLNKKVESEKNTSFCNGPFWDANLTWNTDDPDLTECFRDTILVGIPCALFWCVGLPTWLWRITKYEPNTPQNTDHKDKFRRSQLKGTNIY